MQEPFLTAKDLSAATFDSSADLSVLPASLRHFCFALALMAPLAIIGLHLLPALLAGLLIYVLVRSLAPLLERRLSNHAARLVSVAVLATLLIVGVGLMVVGISAFLHSNASSLPALMQKMAEILESSRAWLPAWVSTHLPADTQEIQSHLATWLREHAGELQKIGGETLRALAHALIGLVVGGLLALREVDGGAVNGPLARLLCAHAGHFVGAFRQVVFAQIRIAAINAVFTAIYLIPVLALFDIHLPLSKSVIVLTFVVGLIPIAGNLISNTVIVILSLSHSLQLALVSLLFLVVLHKLEYFLNARIVGTHIKARAWELLLAMLVMEAVFGIAGLLMAPIYYAFLKAELGARGLV
jgi:predicted PurR-regulated permease PerM